MPRFVKKTSKKAGLSPGTLIHVGEKKVEQVRIRIFDYDAEHLEEKELSAIEMPVAREESPRVRWIHIVGLHDVKVIQTIGEQFDLHPLVLEDILHTDQRPKLEDFEEYVFLTLKMLSYDQEVKEIQVDQFSLVLGPNLVITFQEGAGDVFNHVQERIRKGKGRIRKMGPDYLAYALMDAVLDHYFIVLEAVGEEMEALEAELMTDPQPETLRKLHHLKRELILLRKSVWPLREVVSGLQREAPALFQEKTLLFLRDAYDHTIQIVETIETYRDMVSGMLDIYLSSVSNKMNEVMKVLTVIATIFIPLTFIAGIYGMNFKSMPELEWHWGYFYVLLLMAAVAAGLFVYFKRKRWA